MIRVIFVCYLIFWLNSAITCKIAPVKAPKSDNKQNNDKYSAYFMQQNPHLNNIESIFDPQSLYGFEAQSEESRLRQYLLRNYSGEVRPVVNSSTVTYVKISLTVIQIMDLDEQNQVMITNAQIALKWQDEHLRWEPSEYNNQTRIVFSSKDIWTPDIVLFNSADVAYSTQRDNYLIDVQNNGSITWIFPDILRSYCSVDIKYFPFDRQNCTLELQSWSRSKTEIVVINDELKPFINHPFIHTEWKLLNITVKPNEVNNFVWLEFTLHLKRNHAFYVNHMIFPFAILSSLTLFVFWLPPDSGEKITLTITILLALTVFLQLITEYTPKAAKSLPIIGLYFNVNLILVLVSVILTIIVLNFHFRGPKKQRVPKWMRKYLIGYLGRLLCFCLENPPENQNETYLDVRKSNFLKKNNLATNDKTKDVNECDSMIIQKPQVGENSNVNQNGSPNQDNHTKSYNQRSPETFHELSYNLEKMLVKLQKSFDPLCLKDEDLKFSILKEILECQRLLLNQNIERVGKDTLSINEIYDEWKVLAMIIDRICFFFYLFANAWVIGFAMITLMGST